MKKTVIGIGLGTIAGIIDLLPMVIQKVSFNGCLSAFSMWVVIGFLLTITNLKLNAIIKSIIIALLVLLPNTFIIGWDEPVKLVPIIIITLLIGGLLGYFYERLIKAS
jgi:uncharacterized membrane protein